INQTEPRFLENFARNYHQKLLQINANLFAYMQMLKNDKNATETLIQHIPLTINQAILALAESKAQERENKPTSFTERRTNQTLINQLQKVPEPFQPIKQTADSVYIDKTTGLEL
ncbi:MAG TPA: hypothetical protein PLD88_13240, partial [Candidatus Berkiella sp.]|nr:hypothetical protein [Candidatus Berkiella sp.]